MAASQSDSLVTWMVRKSSNGEDGSGQHVARHVDETRRLYTCWTQVESTQDQSRIQQCQVTSTLILVTTVEKMRSARQSLDHQEEARTHER